MEINYINILEESLCKKSKVLSEIIIKNEQQKLILISDIFLVKDFDKIVEEKTNLIKQLTQLDNGFNMIYHKTKLVLEENKSQFKNEITRMQSLIQEITDKSIQIQVSEAKNKELVEKVFKEERLKLKKGRTTTKVALKYYNSMNRSNVNEPKLMDRKK